MTTPPPTPLPSLYPSFPQLIFLLSHFPFCVWYLVFVCAVNTLENEPETFSPWCSFCTYTHMYCISHILFQDQHLFPMSPFRQQHHSNRCASFTSFLHFSTIFLSFCPSFLHLPLGLRRSIFIQVQQIIVSRLERIFIARLDSSACWW